jgi:MFS family permease
MNSRVLDKPLVLRLIGVIMLAHLAFSGVRLTLTLWAVDRGMSPLAVGLLLSALMIVPMFTSVAMGRWSDRVGFRPPVRLGLWMIFVGGLLAAWVPHLLVLVTGIVLVGWGMTMTQVAASQAIAQAAGPEGITWGFSGLSVGFSSSGFLGPLMAGMLIDRIGHAPTFLVLCIALPTALLVLRAIDSPLLAPVLRSEPEPGGDHRGSLLAVGPIRAALITASLVALSWDLFNFFMPVHAAALGLSATAIGMIVAAYSAGSLTVRLVLGRLPAHIRPGRLLTFALLLTALVYALTPLATGFVSLLLLGLVTGLILGVGQPLAMSLLHQNAPAGRAGEAIGMRSVIVSASQTFLPAVFGAMGSALGTGPVFWVVAGLIVLALAVVRPDAGRP